MVLKQIEVRLHLLFRCQNTNRRIGIRNFFSLDPCLPVVLYGCETWSLILREDRRLRVLENRVLRRIFGPKRVKVTA